VVIGLRVDFGHCDVEYLFKDTVAINAKDEPVYTDNVSYYLLSCCKSTLFKRQPTVSHYAVRLRPAAALQATLKA